MYITFVKYKVFLESFIYYGDDTIYMPRVMLFTMENCETCEEMRQRLSGRSDVDIINLDKEPDKAREVLQDIKNQGDVHFEEIPLEDPPRDWDGNSRVEHIKE